MKRIITLIAILSIAVGCLAQSKKSHHRELVKTESKYNQKNFGFFGVLLGGLGTAIIRKKRITITKEGIVIED